MMLVLALAAAAATRIDRREVMERCAEAVIAARHPNMGMADITGTKFEGMSAAIADDDWVVGGAIVETEGKVRIARHFTCRAHTDIPVKVTFGKVVRVRRVISVGAARTTR